MDAEKSGRTPPKGRGRLVALGTASAILLALLLYSLGSLGAPATTSSSTTITTTSYAVAAATVLASAGAHAPDGYAQGSQQRLSPRESGLESGGYSVFSTQEGAIANVTVLVFDSPQSAQAYIDSVIGNAKGLLGYTDVTAALTSYRQYGVCYGFGQTDPDGNGAVATGVCTKGNVYIQVHLAATTSLPSVEGDMAGFVGAAYTGLG